MNKNSLFSPAHFENFNHVKRGLNRFLKHDSFEILHHLKKCEDKEETKGVVQFSDDVLKWPQPVVSKAFSEFKEFNILRSRTEGRNVYYTVNRETLSCVKNAVGDYFGVPMTGDDKEHYKKMRDIIRSVINGAGIKVICELSKYKKPVKEMQIYSNRNIEQSSCSLAIGQLKKVGLVSVERFDTNKQEVRILLDRDKIWELLCFVEMTYQYFTPTE